MAAYTILHYPLLLFTCGFIYLVFVYIADVFGSAQDIFLNSYSGVITEQTIAAGNFGLALIVSSPALLMMAIAIWALVRGGST